MMYIYLILNTSNRSNISFNIYFLHRWHYENGVCENNNFFNFDKTLSIYLTNASK